MPGPEMTKAISKDHLKPSFVTDIGCRERKLLGSMQRISLPEVGGLRGLSRPSLRFGINKIRGDSVIWSPSIRRCSINLKLIQPRYTLSLEQCQVNRMDDLS